LAVTALRADVLDALDARQLGFENLGDARFDDLGRGARVADLDLHRGGHRIGALAYREIAERQCAERDEQQTEHGRENRALD